MRYRILRNEAGKYKVQSSPMIQSDSAWSRLLSLLRPLAWHDRGKEPSTNCHSLNWRGEEWDTVEQAQEFMAKCHDYDIQTRKEHAWHLVRAFNL